jgi:Rrf2 family protein
MSIVILSKTTRYGIKALAYLASRKALCGLQEIAGDGQIPPVYLRKILGELRRHRFLRSAKGIHGGYELARPPESITLWELFRVLEPDPYFDACILGGQCDDQTSCLLHEDWQNIRKQIEHLLQSRTIAEVAASKLEAAPPTPQE